MAKLINWIILVLSLSVNSVHEEIAEGPRNTLTSVGEKTVLKCCFHNSSPDSTTWSKYPYNEHGHKRKICGKGTCPYNGNYKIDTTVPECNNLVIESSSKNDSTRYECNDAMGSTAAGYVATYNCSTNISNEDDIVEGDRITLRCHIMSHNKPTFQTSWKHENGTIADVIHSHENQTQYESTLTVTAERPELPPYTWTVQILVSSDGSERIDTSTPTANWSSKKMKVAYPVTEIRTDCIDGACERVLGDSIRCFADGYPSPDFSWLNEDGVEISRGPVLKLSSPETQKYKCLAKNLIRGTPYTKSIMAKVFIRETERYPVISITNTCLLCFLILLLVFVFRKSIKAKVLDLWRKLKRSRLLKCFEKNSTHIAKPEDTHLCRPEEGQENSHRDSCPSSGDNYANCQLEENGSADNQKAKTTGARPSNKNNDCSGNNKICQVSE